MRRRNVPATLAVALLSVLALSVPLAAAPPASDRAGETSKDLGELGPEAAPAAAKAVGELEAEDVASGPPRSPGGLEDAVDHFFAAYLIAPSSALLFFDLVFWDDPSTGLAFPLAVFALIFGACFFTLRMGFINFRGFAHAIALVRGRYDNPDDAGEVSHFQALATALSATIGLGNIAGVAVAVSIGGPGATVWMIFAGLLGMASKFTECTLGQKYREIGPDGQVMGGGMQYLSKGLAELGRPRLGRAMAVAFAVLCMGASLGAGGAFQANQSKLQISEQLPFLQTYPWLYGLIAAVLVGVVIIGGIRRIAQVAESIVPLMCGLYMLACLYIIGKNLGHVPDAAREIVAGAFSPGSLYGGFFGVLIMGFRRAAFSNEAGVGSAAIAHSAAKTTYPVQEGFVALLEPFIDTVVVCTMTALVIVITGAHDVQNPVYADLIARQAGAALTSTAMGNQVAWFPYVLSVAVALFAYSTMLSWSYYGERCWSWLFGARYSIVFRLIFLASVFLGSVARARNVIDFGDIMLLGMAIPNIPGLILLSGKVKRDLEDYWCKLRSGELEPKAADS